MNPFELYLIIIVSFLVGVFSGIVVTIQLLHRTQIKGYDLNHLIGEVLHK